jgi:hypothetical protein
MKRFLLRMDASERAGFVNKPDRNGSTSIFHCAWPGHVECVQLLLGYGANVNVQNIRGNTALHMACEKCHVELVALLVEQGARTDVLNSHGKRPLDTTKSRKQFKMVELCIRRATVAYDAQLVVKQASQQAALESSMAKKSKTRYQETDCLVSGSDITAQLQGMDEGARFGYLNLADDDGLTPLLRFVYMGNQEVGLCVCVCVSVQCVLLFTVERGVVFIHSCMCVCVRL